MSGNPFYQVSVTLFMFVTIVLTSEDDSLILRLMEVHKATGEYRKINRQQDICYPKSFDVKFLHVDCDVTYYIYRQPFRIIKCCLAELLHCQFRSSCKNT
jgi:hypothetical protein